MRFINCVHPVYQKKKGEPATEYKPITNAKTSTPRVHVQSPKKPPADVQMTARRNGDILQQSKYDKWLISQVPKYNSGVEYR